MSVNWVWEGIFSLELPEGWEVREGDDLVEIVPPAPVGALHISVLRRSRLGEVVASEASELVTNFAAKQGITLDSIRERAENGVRVAVATYESLSDGRRYSWDVQAKVWLARGIICSFCHDGAHPELRAQALELFASIQPAGGTLRADSGLDKE